MQNSDKTSANTFRNIFEFYFRAFFLACIFLFLQHGQTKAWNTKPGLSFQLQTWLCACHAFIFFETKVSSLELKTQPNQLSDIALPLNSVFSLHCMFCMHCFQGYSSFHRAQGSQFTWIVSFTAWGGKGSTTLKIMTISIMTLCVMTAILIVMAVSITKLRVITLSKMILSVKNNPNNNISYF